MSAVLDFNRTTHREQRGSATVNAVVDSALARKREAQPKRDYLGASAVGDACPRRAQFDYAGAPREQPFPARILRIFDCGHVFESLAHAWLSDAGFHITQRSLKTGELFAFSQLDGRFRGHVDGVVVAAPKDTIGFPCVWEAKALNSKGFKEVVKDGLKRARPQYYAQVQVYMAYLGLTDHPCLFTVTNSDTCEQVHLLVEYDPEEAQAASDKAVRIVEATEAGELLPRPFQDKTHFECKFCPFSQRCWNLPS